MSNSLAGGWKAARFTLLGFRFEAREGRPLERYVFQWLRIGCAFGQRKSATDLVAIERRSATIWRVGNPIEKMHRVRVRACLPQSAAHRLSAAKSAPQLCVTAPHKQATFCKLFLQRRRTAKQQPAHSLAHSQLHLLANCPSELGFGSTHSSKPIIMRPCLRLFCIAGHRLRLSRSSSGQMQIHALGQPLDELDECGRARFVQTSFVRKHFAQTRFGQTNRARNGAGNGRRH